MTADFRKEAFIIVFDSYMKLMLYTLTQCEGYGRKNQPRPLQPNTQPLQDPTVNLSVWTNH